MLTATVHWLPVQLKAILLSCIPGSSNSWPLGEPPGGEHEVTFSFTIPNVLPGTYWTPLLYV
jgi:hypothetical protein